MRIALLTDGIWPFVIGGMQKHSYYLCKFLSRNKVHIDLYHPIHYGEDLNISKVFSKEELSYISLYFVQYPKSNRFPGHYIRSSKKYSQLLYSRFRQNDSVDLIYAKGLTAWSFLKSKNKGAKLPLICINVHGYEYYQKTFSFRGRIEQMFLRPAFKFINENADFIYSYGGKITSIILEKLQQDRNKIIEIPTGIEEGFLVQRIKDLPPIMRFVFLGRNEERKGINDINRSIASLTENYDFEFHFIGDINKESQLDLRNVVYHGVLKNVDSIKEILSNSDVLVCPSYSEGMPNVILEGMACGCAIIASDVGAVSVMVRPENGWLINPGYDALKNAMIKALDTSPVELEMKRTHSLALVKENFLWNNISDKLISSFKQILSC